MKKHFLIHLVLVCFSTVIQAQSIIGTWYTLGLAAFQQSATDQKLVITEDSIIFYTTITKYNYEPAADSNDGYIRTNPRDSVQTMGLKIATIKTDKFTDRGYIIIETPRQVSGKEKPSYTVMRYVFADEKNCTVSIATKNNYKTKKEAEKSYKDLHYYDMYTLISESRSAHLKTLKDSKLITREDMLIVLTDLRGHFANVMATIDKDSKREEALGMGLLTGITTKI
jgi:hypothetical protein